MEEFFHFFLWSCVIFNVHIEFLFLLMNVLYISTFVWPHNEFTNKRKFLNIWLNVYYWF